MMTDTARVPAGWYPDPLGLPQLRWWDNHSWTEHTSDSRVPLVVQETITTQARIGWADPPADDLPAPGGDAPQVAQALLTARAPRELERAAAPAPSGPTASASASPASSASASFAPEVEEVATTPVPIDLSALADAVVDAQASTGSQLIEFVLGDGELIRLDVAENLMWSDHEPRDLARELSGARVRRLSGISASVPTQAGRDAEVLLWTIGTRSPLFVARSAVDTEARFKLRRWPNLTALDHTTEQLSMTAMLAHAHLTVAELAALASVSDHEARTLVTGFQLMGLLARVEEPATPAVTGAIAPTGERTTGLFGRLRRRLGI